MNITIRSVARQAGRDGSGWVSPSYSTILHRKSRPGAPTGSGKGPSRLFSVITIFGTLHLNPALRDEAIREFEHLVDDVSKEDGCQAYVVSADLVDPHTLYIFEEWDDIDALQAHQRSGHFTAHQSRSAGHLVGAEISQYEVASAERRSAGTRPGGRA